jgi:hypothetical protein
VEWTVPDGVSTIKVEVKGAGGKENGGAGGLVTATLEVEVGMVLTMVVGGAGRGLGLTRVTVIAPRDYNHKKGGGLVGIFTGKPQAGGTPLIIAGSGGGGGSNCGSTGGAGGGEIGEQGRWNQCRNEYTWKDELFKGTEMAQNCMGAGGTQTAGGKAGLFKEGVEGLPFGALAVDGEMYTAGGHGAYGSDGGAGYYGGGGGSHCPSMSGGSGGGGSSYVTKDASDVNHVRGGGARAEGDGSIIITYA